MLLYFVGWLVIMVVFPIVATRWFDLHQRTHNQWRPRSTLWLLSPSPEESRQILRAPWRRDPDPDVERRRRIYVLVLALAVAYLVIGFPLAVWLLA